MNPLTHKKPVEGAERGGGKEEEEVYQVLIHF